MGEMERMTIKIPQMNAMQHKLEKHQNDIKTMQRTTLRKIGSLKDDVQLRSMAM
jgi:hypothetical protein